MTENLLSDPTIRTLFLEQVRLHEQQDRIIQGTYAEDEGNVTRFRGCYFGCAWNSLRIAVPAIDKAFGPSDREEIAAAMGLPLRVARVAEGIFEGLPTEEAPAFARAMAEVTADAAARAANLEMVWPRFIIPVLVGSGRGIIWHARTNRQRAAIQNVADLYSRTLEGVEVTRQEWKDAARAAARAADARYAARRWQRDLLLRLMAEA